MEEFVRMTLVSQADEPSSGFKTRLIDFWTRILRTYPDQYAEVYAETVGFDDLDGRSAKQYLVGQAIVDLLERELIAMGIECKPIDREDLYSKYEAAPPEWFQIPH